MSAYLLQRYHRPIWAGIAMASSRTKNFVDLRHIDRVEDRGVITAYIEPRGQFKDRDPRLSITRLNGKFLLLFTYRNGGTWVQERLGSYYFKEFDYKFEI
jgi:hypothetical protein